MTGLAHSRYNILVPLRDGRTLAYNSMSGATALWEETDSQIFKRIGNGEEFEVADEIVSNLLYGGFVVPDDVNELAVLQQQYDAQRYDPTGMVLTIAPTLGCNFGCDYCFQGAHKPTNQMRKEVQDAIVALVQRVAGGIKRLHVAWYGGEPLLARGVVESLSDRLIELTDAASIDYDAMIVTNGFRLTPETAASLYTRRVKVAQVTLDGAADYHDRRRTLLGGQGTFDRIIENVRRVVDEVSLRIVIRINIDSRNSHGIARLLEYLHELGLGGRKNFNVYFAPVEAITEGCHAVSDVCMSKKGYAAIESELQRQAYQLGLASLPYPQRFRGICGALRPRGFVVVPSGDIHKCWDTVSMSHMKVGSIFNLNALNTDERVLTWMRWTPFENETCRSCKILPNCAGSCAHKFINPGQTTGEAGSLPCPSWKYQI